MSKNITIITYHYVRKLIDSQFPHIKGLETDLFEEQLKYLIKHYQIITMEDLIEAIENKNTLPKKSALLTFDDGYYDHFKYVFPLLEKHKVQSSFYPPSKSITEHRLLNVNKIHFILAKENNENKIIIER